MREINCIFHFLHIGIAIKLECMKILYGIDLGLTLNFRKEYVFNKKFILILRLSCRLSACH